MQNIEDFKSEMDQSGPPKEITLNLTVTYQLEEGFGVIRTIETIKALVDEANTMGRASGVGTYGDKTFKVD